jgi:signal transduction histidine kinase
MRWLPPLPRPSGSALVIVLLSLAVLVTGGLSLEAVRSARTARTTAEGVLRDYAAIAAVQFARETQARLDTHVSTGLSAARHRLDRHIGDLVRPGVRECDCAPPDGTETTFAVGRDGLLSVDGEPIDPALAAELSAAVAPPAPMARPSLRLLDDGRVLVTVAAWRQNRPVTIGMVAAASWLDSVFRRVIAEASLLPGTLVDRARTCDVLTLRVLDANNRERFRTDDAWSAFSGEAPFAAHLAGLRVAAAIKPDRASMLLLDGLPSERWTLVIGLLLLAAGLVTAAAVQLRREIRFARQRADFVSGVSHELRTPLAQIRLFGETLMLGRVRSRDEERRAAEVIVQEARRLTQLVDNVLLFSRAGRGLTPIAREVVDAAALTAQVIETFRPQAASRQAAIEWSAPAGSLLVHADPNALRQVLLNLLDNAAKYGPRGQTIRVRLTHDGAMLGIAVEDDGPGVPAADAPRIWEPFWRAGGSPEGGTGLGLSIVRELSTRHGGAAVVEAAPGGGARFVVTVDAPAVAPQPSRSAAPAADQPA